MRSTEFTLWKMIGAGMALALSGAIGAEAAVRLSTERSAPASMERQARAGRTRFYVTPSRERKGVDATAYCERVIQQIGVARLVDSAQEADFVLSPSARLDSRLSRVGHYKEVRVTYEENGQQKTKKEQRKMHEDDVLNVSTRFLCRIVRLAENAEPREIIALEGRSQRATSGVTTSGHDAEDRPIRFYSFEAERLEQQLGALEHNDAQGRLYKAIYELCGVQGPVTEVDSQANRLTVQLGSEDGVRDKDDPSGVTEMEIYAQTGRLPEYVYRDPDTGQLYIVERGAGEGRERREDWTFVRTDLLRGEKKTKLQGAEAARLLPLGERIAEWAEVQEVRSDSCIVALKRKGDFGRTTDDKTALERLPDPHNTPLIARVRAKKGNLRTPSS